MSRFQTQLLRAAPLVFGLALVFFGAAKLRADFQGSSYLVPYDDAPFSYSQSEPRDVVFALQAKLDKGDAQLKFEPQHGYLLSLLDELKVPKSSQLLVFSKTSLQRDHISPETPRALFFNDDVYVGYIPGAPIIEVSVADPKLGANFYTLEQEKPGAPKLTRSTQCLECHASSRSLGVPGHLVRSFLTYDSGMVDFGTGPKMVNDRTPLSERWGGWYVTGTHGNQAHLGNLIGEKAFVQHEKDAKIGANVTDLKPYFDTQFYVSPHSDIVAHMVLNHQSHMHNFLARLNYEAATRIARYGEVKYTDSMVESFLKYLLFTEETPLSAPVKGTSEFAKEFAARGPKDKKGRSLRDFDLQTRLFKYRCSFLIYSEAFNALPPKLKENIYRRLWEILSGKDTKPDFKNLSPDDRRAILEILADTKTDLPDYWKK